MQVHRGIEFLPEIKNPVVTTGSFDGVHVGHKAIIRRLKQLAEQIKGETVLITFHPHPRLVLYPDTEGKDLQLIHSQAEKIEMLEQTGLNHLVIIPFSLEFSKTTSQEFLDQILLNKIGASVIVVGFNHYFGFHREGNYDYLYRQSREKGFAVEEIPVQEIQNETVSSTKIRKALREGNIQRANAYLDDFYFIEGPLAEGNQNLRRMGFSTYTLGIEEPKKLIPPQGVYAVRLLLKNQEYRGMLNILHATDSAKPLPFLEFHLFTQPPSLPGMRGRLVFHKRMRDHLFFSSEEELKKQLETDRKEISDLIY